MDVRHAISLALAAAVVLLAAAPARAASDACDSYLEAMTCDNSSQTSASWCEYQAPLLIPQPLTQLTQDMGLYADYEPQYQCESDDWDAECSLVTTFVPAQVSHNESAIYDKVIVVGTHAQPSDAYPWRASTFTVFTPTLDTVLEVQQSLAVSDVSLSDLAVDDDPDAELRMVTYGGNHPDTLAAELDFQWAEATGNWSEQIYHWMGTFEPALGFEEPGLWTFPDGVVSADQFQYNFTDPDGSWQTLNCMATMTVSTTDDLEWAAWFLCANQSRVMDPNRSRAWVIELPDASHGQVTIDIVEQHTCADDAGSFENEDLCSGRILVVLTDAQQVAIYEYDPTATDGFLTLMSFVSGYSLMNVASLQLPYGADAAPDTIFFEPSSDEQTVTSAVVFGQRISWVNLTSTDHVELNDTNIPTNWTLVSDGDVLQPLVLAVATAGGGELYEYELNVVALPEFGNEAHAPQSLTDPAGLGEDGCADTRDYFDGLACVPRETHLAYGDDSQVLVEVQERWRALPDDATGNCTEDLTACLDGIVDSATEDSLETLYGARHVLFARTDARAVIVAYVVEYPPDCSEDGQTMSAQTVNELAMMGNVDVMTPTDNAQFLFTSITRQRWELEGMERLVEICDTLADDPTNAFLAPWQETCDTSEPRLPQVADFMQIASACPAGTYCDTFDEEVIEVLGDGEFSFYEFDRQTCRRGSYCYSGVRFTCPIGFTCPDAGMSTPQRCDFDTSRQTTCGYEGLVEPEPVTDGTMAVAPYAPPLPASPGFDVADVAGADDDEGALELEACALGEWCDLGMASSMGLGSLNCTGGFYCSDPSVLTPTLCDWDGTCTADSCPVMPWCPAGSSEQVACPAGYYCSDTSTEKYDCGTGAYCPAGTSLWQACPEKYYCPTPEEAIICPAGYYCPLASVSPTECGPLDVCKEGSASVQSYTPVLVLTVGPAVLYGAYVWYQRTKLKRRDEREALRKTMLERQEAEMPAMGASASSDDMRESLLGGAGGGPRALMNKDFTIDFEFENLGLNIKGSGKSVLAGVTGAIRHGRVTAVMGPSGAGKSTFVTTLAGKAYYGDQVGVVKINGVEQSLTKFKKLVGFVPQEDIMLRELTVKENIASSARLRLPVEWTSKQRHAYINTTLDMLGLREIRHSRIGDETKRGISGGQRKRVNIGMELVADPTVIFLDEPTSGLDSTSSMEVCSALRKIADAGITIVTVIHQIFCAFHDVLLLGKGGRTVYLGPSADALGYFERYGIECPERVNPPDFMMDVIAGDVPPEFARAHPEWRPDDLFGWWEDHLATLKEQQKGQGQDEQQTYYPSADLERQALQRKQASFQFMVRHFFTRAVHQLARAKRNLVLDCGLVFVAASFLGAVYYGDPWSVAPLPSQAFEGCPADISSSAQTCFVATGDAILNRGSMTCIGIGLTATASMIRIFGSEKVVYWRESAALEQPWATIAYFIGKDLAMLPLAFVAPFVYDLVFHAMTSPRASFGTFYWSLFLLYWTSMGISYVVSIVAPPALSQLVGVVAVFGNAMFAGGSPTYSQLLDKWVPLCWMPHVSYMRYGLEAFYVGEAREWKDVDELMGLDLEDFVKENYGYSLDAWSSDLFVLFLFGVLFRVIAVVAMSVKDRDKKL